MGLVVCRKHGNAFLYVCPHVVEAVQSNSPCRGIEYRVYSAANVGLEGFELGCWFCPTCIADHALPPIGTALADPDPYLIVTNSLYRPMCPGCFDDWRASDRV